MKSSEDVGDKDQKDGRMCDGWENLDVGCIGLERKRLGVGENGAGFYSWVVEIHWED